MVPEMKPGGSKINTLVRSLPGGRIMDLRIGRFINGSHCGLEDLKSMPGKISSRSQPGGSQYSKINTR